MTYRRCTYRSRSWRTLIDAGWVTLCVNSEGVALMAKDG